MSRALARGNFDKIRALCAPKSRPVSNCALTCLALASLARGNFDEVGGFFHPEAVKAYSELGGKRDKLANQSRVSCSCARKFL